MASNPPKLARKKRRGPPTLCTPERTKTIVDYLGDPNATIGDACAEAGVSRWAYVDWMRKGEESEQEPYRTFFLLVSEARSKQAKAMLELGDAYATDGNKSGVSWTQWKLSKLHAKSFGERQQIELSGPGGGPIETQELAPQERKEVIVVLQELEKGGEDDAD